MHCYYVVNVDWRVRAGNSGNCHLTNTIQRPRTDIIYHDPKYNYVGTSDSSYVCFSKCSSE